MAVNKTLFLHEEIMLLVLRDKKGTVEPGIFYQQALGGAILADLLLQERVRVAESGKKKLLEVCGQRPAGDPVIDECLRKVRDAKRRASLQTWVSRFAGVKNLKHRVARQLCHRNILRSDEDKVMLIFSRKIYPELDPRPEKKLVGRLHEAIFTDKQELDPRVVILASLAHQTGLLKRVFDKKELKSREERIDKLINGEFIGQATKEAIQAAQAAIVVASMMPAMMASTTAAR